MLKLKFKRYLSVILSVVMVLGLAVPMTAVASGLPDGADALHTLISGVHGKLTPTEQATVGAVNGTGLTSDAIDPIWTAIGPNLSISNDPDLKEELFDFVVDLTLLPYKNSDLLQLWDTHNNIIGELLDAGGIAGGFGGIAWTDFSDYAVALEAAIAQELSNPSKVLGLVSALESGTGFADELDAVLQPAIASVITNSSLKVSNLYTGLGVTGAQIIEVRDNILGVVDSNNEATKALGLGYLRSKAVLSPLSTSSNALTPQLKLLGVTVPIELITWTPEPDKNVAFSNGAFRFSSTGSVTVEVTANENVTDFEYLLFKGSISFNYNPTTDDTGTGGPGGGPAPTPTPAPAPQVEETAGKLTELAANLEDLPEADKKAAVKDAEKEVAKAIKETAKVAVNTQVADGKATATLNATDIAAAATAAKAAADELNKQLEAIGGQKAKVELTLDLGTLGADQAEVALDSTVMQALIDAGVDTVAVSANGVEIVIDPRELSNGATLNLNKKEVTPEQQQATDATFASDVYEFEFTVDDHAVHEFSSPVELRIPVKEADQYDTDLLTLAKLIEDRLQYYVGKYDSETGSVRGLRDSLSSYTIIENKVEFGDTDSVKSWAGRSIQVAAAKGIIVGDGQGSFSPVKHVTRAEFVKMLVATFSLADAKATEAYLDVNDNQWFSSYVKVAVSKGIIDDGGLFHPNAAITREEMAEMVGRVLKNELGAVDVANADDVLKAFSDGLTVKAALKSAVAITISEGIMVGSDGQFNPTGKTTRAQAAVVIKKLLDLR